MEDLPNELLIEISKRLCPRDAARLAQVSRTQYIHARDPYRVHLMAKDFTQCEKNKLLLECAENGDLYTFIGLLTMVNPADINALLQDVYHYYTPFTIAAKNGKLTIVKYIVENYPQILGRNRIRGFVHQDYKNALTLAAQNGHLDVIQYLFDKGLKCNIVKYAAGKGQLDVVKYLVSIDPKNNYKNEMQWAATKGAHKRFKDVSCKARHIEIIKYLAKQCPSTKDSYLELVKYLKKYYISPYLDIKEKKVIFKTIYYFEDYIALLN